MTRSRELPLSETIPPGMWEAISQAAQATGRFVVMHSGAPWDLAGGAQRPRQLAEQLASHAAVVHLSLNEQDERIISEGLAVGNVRSALKWTGIDVPHKLFYTAFPDGLAVTIRRQLKDGWFRVYDCVDAWQHFEGNAWYKEDLEEELVQEADLVLCTATRLGDHVANLGASPEKILHLRNSTRIAGRPYSPGLSRDVDCVYVGWLDDSWLHWKLFEDLARLGHTLRIIGPLPKAGAPFQHPNVEWAGEIHSDVLLDHLATARLGIIPFHGPVAEAVFPIKYLDYLAAGLPTVASHLPELDGLPFAWVAYSDEAFLGYVDGLLAKPELTWDRRSIAQLATKHTAEARVKVLISRLQDTGRWGAW